MDNGWDHFAESVRLGVNPCPLWDNTLGGHILLNLGYWLFKVDLVNRMVIIIESSIGAFLHRCLL
jgi:hypothetical protein